jgi:putative membrane protein
MSDTQDAGGGSKSAQELAQKRTEIAEQRTEWAEHRTLLANERTFSAWLRTGLSSIGGGLAVAQLLTGESYGLLPRIVGLLLVLFGIAVLVLAFWRYQQIADVLDRERQMRVAPRWVTYSLLGLLFAAAAVVLGLIWMQ